MLSGIWIATGEGCRLILDRPRSVVVKPGPDGQRLVSFGHVIGSASAW